MKSCYIYNMNIGKILISQTDNAISEIKFYREDKNFTEKECLVETTLINETYIQLSEYFSGKRKIFDIPLAPKGSVFQHKVWEALKNIPYGETRSYKDIAAQIGNENASRAVGMANNKNPIIIMIPCHRVIGSNGQLIGYGGGLHVKEYLLKLENPNYKMLLKYEKDEQQIIS